MTISRLTEGWRKLIYKALVVDGKYLNDPINEQLISQNKKKQINVSPCGTYAQEL